MNIESTYSIRQIESIVELEEAGHNYLKSTKSSKKKEVVIDAYGQPHKFGEIPRYKEYESENPLRIKSKTMSMSKVHPLMNCIEDSPNIQRETDNNNNNNNNNCNTTKEEIVHDYQINGTGEERDSSKKKKVKCKYGFCILKGIIMTGLVGTLATFVVLYINERNELNSVKDKMKILEDSSKRQIENIKDELEHLKFNLNIQQYIYDSIMNKTEYIRAQDISNVKIKDHIMEQDRYKISEERGGKFTNYQIESFVSAEYEGGITLWEVDDPLNISSTYSPIHSYNENRHHMRGVVDKNNIYIVAGGLEKKVYFYDLNSPVLESTQTPNFSDQVFECFLKNSSRAICCDIAGKLSEIELDHPMHFSFPVLPFADDSASTHNDNFRSCMMTSNGYILAGGNARTYIYDSAGNYINKFTTAPGGPVYQIAEIRPNILITAESGRAFIHDISNTAAIASMVMSQDYGTYQAVISLSSNLGDFALGGRNFIKIQHLEADNVSVNLLREKLNMPGNGNCTIRVIKETKKGVILFGGYSCQEICIWYYEINEFPVCWDAHAFTIHDIFLIPHIS